MGKRCLPPKQPREKAGIEGATLSVCAGKKNVPNDTCQRGEKEKEIIASAREKKGRKEEHWAIKEALNSIIHI